MPYAENPSRWIRAEILARNPVSAALFEREAAPLAQACRAMSERFLAGGRILAFGRGPYATDAQHVSVEFVHPVIVGKRALPALDLSAGFPAWLDALVRAEDMAMGFGPPGGDPNVSAALDRAAAAGAMTLALPGLSAEPGTLAAPDDGSAAASYALALPEMPPFVHQEMVEILYHTLWETVHVFFEHRELGHDPGASGFLYPFLGRAKQETGSVVAGVAASIEAKAREDERLRQEVASTQADRLVLAASELAARWADGGTVIALGNGGSATDANDLALDCAMPPPGRRALPAISLAMESPNLSAIANDIGTDAIFLRQLIAQARPGDAVVAFSTSGSSRNVVAALTEARKRGLFTVALVGYDGGAIERKQLADVTLVAPSDHIPRIQEVHATMYHVLLEAVWELLDAGA